MADSELHKKGSAIRQQLLGDAYVQKVNETTYRDPVMRKFIDVATETVFGALWSRPGLDLKTRTLVCVVSDAATGRDPELAIHLRMALRQGWTEEELSADGDGAQARKRLKASPTSSARASWNRSRAESPGTAPPGTPPGRMASRPTARSSLIGPPTAARNSA